MVGSRDSEWSIGIKEKGARSEHNSSPSAEQLPAQKSVLWKLFGHGAHANSLRRRYPLVMSGPPSTSLSLSLSYFHRFVVMTPQLNSRGRTSESTEVLKSQPIPISQAKPTPAMVVIKRDTRCHRLETTLGLGLIIGRSDALGHDQRTEGPRMDAVDLGPQLRSINTRRRFTLCDLYGSLRPPNCELPGEVVGLRLPHPFRLLPLNQPRQL